jgi:hypothetical protein
MTLFYGCGTIYGSLQSQVLISTSGASEHGLSEFGSSRMILATSNYTPVSVPVKTDDLPTNMDLVSSDHSALSSVNKNRTRKHHKKQWYPEMSKKNKNHKELLKWQDDDNFHTLGHLNGGTVENSQHQLLMPNFSFQHERQNRVNQLRNHRDMLVSERRHLVEENQKMMQDKIRFQLKLSGIVKDIEKDGVVEVRKRPDIGVAVPVDPNQWEGLNSTELHSRYPGIVLSKEYLLGRHFVAPEEPKAAGMQGLPHSIEDMTDGQAEDRFYQILTTLDLECLEIRRMGSFDDGGWDLCTVEPYDFKPGCIVYSFGINFDFTFDDAMAVAFKCSVKSFDPSMTVKDYLRSANVYYYQLGIGSENTVTDKGWKLMTLRSIQAKLHHTEKLIDVVKLDIEYNEWVCLQQMVTDGSLNNVKQLIFEIHTPEVETVQRPSSKQDFLDMYLTLAALEHIGFRKYHYHSNPLGHYTSVRTGKTRSCCYELYYINIHFLKEHI